MEIVKLPPSTRAPDDSDSVRIERTPEGQFHLTGSALMFCADPAQTESVSMIAGEPYLSHEEAEAAGLAWAAGCCVERLYIETDKVG